MYYSILCMINSRPGRLSLFKGWLANRRQKLSLFAAATATFIKHKVAFPPSLYIKNFKIVLIVVYNIVIAFCSIQYDLLTLILLLSRCFTHRWNNRNALHNMTHMKVQLTPILSALWLTILYCFITECSWNLCSLVL